MATGYSVLTVILLCFLIVSGVFGNVMVNTPFVNSASILSWSTPTGISMNRSNDPNSRSWK